MDGVEKLLADNENAEFAAISLTGSANPPIQLELKVNSKLRLCLTKTNLKFLNLAKRQ
jgi:hypothetical protein